MYLGKKGSHILAKKFSSREGFWSGKKKAKQNFCWRVSGQAALLKCPRAVLEKGIQNLDVMMMPRVNFLHQNEVFRCHS